MRTTVAFVSDTVPDPDVTARLLRGRLADGPLELPVSGSSMRGVIESGAIVDLSAADEPRVGEIWAFVDDDGNLVVHRIRHVAPDQVVGRGSGNIRDDAPVRRHRLVGRVRTATTEHGPRTFGEGDRRRAAVAFRLRELARSVRNRLRPAR